MRTANEVIEKIDNFMNINIDEAKKFPTRLEAQLLLDYMRGKKISGGGLTGQFSKFFIKHGARLTDIAGNQQYLKLWQKAFGDNSPWVVTSRKGDREIKWDKTKAGKLQLGDKEPK